MSNYTYRDMDGDTLQFTIGLSSTLVVASAPAENLQTCVNVPNSKAVEVAQALLDAAGIKATIELAP